ncbi:unnamed protein product [Microthlaspi erraticum]|uniref:Arabidopsis retrotransposon Orf1 C-terminal domain-containing protein n=1 Tax=Microthlaspi erraticum TaxID=1685480 RepID=A0A6D2J403_9BRAS|nr:unnamed protein product [Microthlaspi erraticum]CAA7049928.1 unnamed protein product [Microthlaspi erraticum]
MEEAESEEEEHELPMYQEHYNALFSMDFVETKYPHDDTMRALGIFEYVELVLKNMRLGKFFSHRMESYKELTCDFLASMRFHKYGEFDRAELDLGMDNILGKRRKEGDHLQAAGDPLWILLFKIQGCSDKEPYAKICTQGPYQHLLCKEGHCRGPIRQEEVNSSWMDGYQVDRPLIIDRQFEARLDDEMMKDGMKTRWNGLGRCGKKMDDHV